jgi:hypothetical protein
MAASGVACLQGRRLVAVFSPFGHPTLYAYEPTHTFILCLTARSTGGVHLHCHDEPQLSVERLLQF